MIPWVIGGIGGVIVFILLGVFILRSLIVMWATKGEEKLPPRRLIPHGWFERGEEV